MCSRCSLDRHDGDGGAELARVLDGAVGRMLSALKWLAIPIGLLLFLQWPLREYVKAYSREANDLGQWLFALYVAAAVTAATRAGTHLAVDTLAKRYVRARAPPPAPRLQPGGAGAVGGPRPA